MRLRPLVVAALLAAAACSPGPDLPPEAPDRAAEESRLTVQAVDAGTGAALSDDAMRVRYLVRTPVTVDAAAVDEVSTTEPYAVAHAVATDSLVVELRLEAASYHTLDTVVAVARGASVGPLTVRMARRLDRAASTDARARPGASTPAPAAARPQPTAPSAPADGIDRTGLRAGDQFFQAGRWLDAVASYRTMATPSDPSGAYAREYQGGLVRKALAHLELGEFAGALESLEAAVAMPYPHPDGHLRLAAVQCSVGRIDPGLATVTRLEQRVDQLPAGERPRASALARYEAGRCYHRAFGQAEGTLPRIRVGNQAVQAFEAFLEAAPGVSGGGTEMATAVVDARAKVEEIRTALRRGG
ncbi:MAG: hypothetical protein RJQ04_15790 [Longimicrobiales bacterium]